MEGSGIALGRFGAATNDLGAGPFFVVPEVGEKEVGEFAGALVKGVLIVPAVTRDEDIRRDFGNPGDGFEAKNGIGFRGGLGEFAVVDALDDGAGIFELNALADAVTSLDPAGVDEPDIDLVVLHFLGEELGVARGVHDEEGSSEAGGESGGGLGNAHLGAGDLGGVAGDEVVHGLFLAEF